MKKKMENVTVEKDKVLKELAESKQERDSVLSLKEILRTIQYLSIVPVRCSTKIDNSTTTILLVSFSYLF